MRRNCRPDDSPPRILDFVQKPLKIPYQTILRTCGNSMICTGLRTHIPRSWYEEGLRCKHAHFLKLMPELIRPKYEGMVMVYGVNGHIKAPRSLRWKLHFLHALIIKNTSLTMIAQRFLFVLIPIQGAVALVRPGGVVCSAKSPCGAFANLL